MRLDLVGVGGNLRTISYLKESFEAALQNLGCSASPTGVREGIHLFSHKTSQEKNRSKIRARGVMMLK